MTLRPETFLNGRVSLFCGDNREVLRSMPDCSIDSYVTDPPYALVSVTKRYSAVDAKPCGAGTDGSFRRLSKGFMGKTWDTGEVAFDPEFWRECLRVLKPGGHVVAFSGTRTYHRMAVAIEDAGFEIRDQIGWTYGSGFPKSHDVSKGIDRMNGTEPKILERGAAVKRMIPGADQNKSGWEKTNGREYVPTVTAAGSPEAAEWEGWGTAIKPAWEPICLARKPLSEKTVAANVLKWGTGAINVDGCRIGETVETWPKSRSYAAGQMQPGHIGETQLTGNVPSGRFPANIIHDGSEEVLAAFPTVGDSHPPSNAGSVRTNKIYGADEAPRTFHAGFPDSGSAARFFYTAKADADDRLGSKHPTVKPVDLMQWLVRLVTPKGGTVMDCFAGTGTTAEAAYREGMRCILIERESEYQADIRRRMALVMSGSDERSRESIKAKTKGKPVDAGPLFGGAA